MPFCCRLSRYGSTEGNRASGALYVGLLLDFSGRVRGGKYEPAARFSASRREVVIPGSMSMDDLNFICRFNVSMHASVRE